MKDIQIYETAVQEGILLNANERSQPLSESFLKEVSEAVMTLTLNRYPDNDQRELLQAYAQVTGTREEMLLAGNGSDQILGYLIGTFLNRGKVLYTFDPDFSMYDYYAGTYEATVRKFDINADGSLDIGQFIENGRKENAAMVLFSNPNNPSGHCLGIDEIEHIVSSFADIPVCVDEAYIEFADAESAVSLLDRYDNLYVTRTLSKAYGLAGLRVGFLISSPGNMEKLKAAYVPYTLNAFSMKAAAIALSHHDEAEAYIAGIRSERKRMLEALQESRRACYIPSATNFIYGMSSDKARLTELFEKEGIVIRDYRNSDSFRITIGTGEENDLVLKVLKTFEEEKPCGQ